MTIQQAGVMQNRKAVSVVLCKSSDSSQVYLVERNPRLRFFGGYFAFPGGTLDDDDPSIPATNVSALSDERVPYILAAAREVFEETGILLTCGDNAIQPERRREYRDALLTGQISFRDILLQAGHVVDLTDFHFICHLLTPEFAPVRYDTQFYWAEIPPGQDPEIIPGELVDGGYYDASAALTEWRHGRMQVVPPVTFMLNEFAASSVAAGMVNVVKEAEEYRAGALHQIYFTPGVQMLPLKTRTLFPASHTNAYLVGEADMLLIDPAPADDDEQERLWRFLDKRISEGKKLSAILLTHHHADHVGAVSACQRRYKLPLLGHKLTADYLPDLAFDRYLEDGDVLPLGQSPDGQPDWTLKVYHTPGHASGHLAFQESRYGAVIAGDMISTLSTIVINPPDGHMATYMHSLHRLLEITTGTIYPSHGPAVATGRALLQHFIDHRNEREKKLLAALSHKAQRADELVREVYDDVDATIWRLAERSLEAGLIKLIEEGRCVQTSHGYCLAR